MTKLLKQTLIRNEISCQRCSDRHKQNFEKFILKKTIIALNISFYSQVEARELLVGFAEHLENELPEDLPEKKDADIEQGTKMCIVFPREALLEFLMGLCHP